jgi:hypothetical protein
VAENPAPLLTCEFFVQGLVRLGTVVKNSGTNTNKEVISVETQPRVHHRQHHLSLARKVLYVTC